VKPALRFKPLASDAKTWPEGMVPFGWQGISALVPPDWNLAGIGGDFQSGYLRLDDGRMARLEIKWSPGDVDLNKALDRYLRGLEKKGRRRTGITTFKGGRAVSRRSKPDKRLQGFSWRGPGVRGPVEAQGCIWRCRTCSRTVVAQVMAPPGEGLASLARTVLTSLEDHARDGLHTWGVYGLVCRIPEAFRMEKQRLMAGYIELLFTHGKSTLRVERWGMANVILSDVALGEWVERQNRKRKDVRLSAEPARAHGHEAAALAGHRRRPFHGLRLRLERGLRRRVPTEFAGQVWHCPPSNRIYSVESMHWDNETPLGKVVDSVVCHVEGAAGRAGRSSD
jgi:hypothetical protein